MQKKGLSKEKMCILTFICLCLFSGKLLAQDSTDIIRERVITLDGVVELALSNHPQLTISKRLNEIARQEREVSVQERLPQLSVSGSISYTGDAFILDTDFSGKGKSDNIHFGQHLGLDIYQLIYDGHRIKKNIESKDLVVQLTQLDLQVDQQDIKLLVAQHYIALFNLENQENVYVQNIELARTRMAQINSLFKQGMITNDDVIRAELQLSELLLKKEQLRTQMEIVQNQLTLATGLKGITIRTDPSFLKENQETLLSDLDYIGQAYRLSPRLKRAERAIDLHEKNLEIIKTSQYPTFYAFSSNNLDRPLRSTSPQRDLYANVWAIGIGVKYDISNLYTIGKKTKLQELNIGKTKDVLAYERLRVEQNISDIEKLERLAWSQWQTFQENEKLANENYRITEKKYFNQLALFIDLFNAGNLKLEAELKSATAHAEAVYTHYRLLNAIGNL